MDPAISLSDSFVNMDIALRGKSSLEPVKLIGKVPISSTKEIDLRIESHGDALNFLDGLSNGNFIWKKGFFFRFSKRSFGHLFFVKRGRNS